MLHGRASPSYEALERLHPVLRQNLTSASIGTIPRPEQRRQRAMDSSGPSKLSFDGKVSEAAYVGCPGTSSASVLPSECMQQQQSCSVGLPLAVTPITACCSPCNPSVVTGSEWLQPMPRSSNRRSLEPPFRKHRGRSAGSRGCGLPCGMKPSRRCQPRKADNGRPTTARLTFRRHRVEENDGIPRARALCCSKMLADESLHGSRSIV